MKMAILELEYKNIRKITALKLPFTKADGSVISNNFIMMANGTGKTTTMELIKGLFDGTAAGWTASKVRSFAPTLTEADTGEFSMLFYNDLTSMLNGWHGQEGEYAWRMSLFASPKQSAIVRIVQGPLRKPASY